MLKRFALLRPFRSIPPEHRWNFFHWCMDMVWFGILSGSTLSFVSIYAARLGANPTQIGLISAVPAIANLIFALPAGEWLSRRSMGRSVFWFAILSRIFYMTWVILPMLFAAMGQIQAIIISILILSIPGTVVTVGVNALIADTVPSERIAQVVGMRNAALAISSVAASLASGQILVNIQFPLNYQIVFGIGFLGAMLSTVHLKLIRSIGKKQGSGDSIDWLLPNTSEPEMKVPWVQSLKKVWTNFKGIDLLRLDIIKSPFRRVIFLLFFFHLGQYFGIPIFPLFLVNQLHFNDQVISIGTSLFNGLLFLGSTQLARVTRILGNKKATGLSIMLISLYPLINAMAKHEGLYYLASIIGGLIFSIVGGALFNYLLEKIPAGDRPSHLAWYNLALNAAILLGSLSGPLAANYFGFVNALLICAVLRALSGVFILRWG